MRGPTPGLPTLEIGLALRAVLRSPEPMSLDERDELAAKIAAMIDTHGDLGAGVVARRAYDLAEALLHERHHREVGFHEAADELVEHGDPRLDAPPHDPAWEVEPRWSRPDRASLDQRLDRLGPGLAAVRPITDADERTGS